MEHTLCAYHAHREGSSERGLHCYVAIFVSETEIEKHIANEHISCVVSCLLRLTANVIASDSGTAKNLNEL